MKTWEDCTPAQKVERWENVLRVLRAMTPHQREKHFDMGTWLEVTNCGTVGCAAGLCGLDSWFRRRGFVSEVKLCIDGDEKWSEHKWPKLSPHQFFGLEGYDTIFTGGHLTCLRGKDAYREVTAAVKDYIKVLKNDAKQNA